MKSYDQTGDEPLRNKWCPTHPLAKGLQYINKKSDQISGQKKKIKKIVQKIERLSKNEENIQDPVFNVLLFRVETLTHIWTKNKRIFQLLEF